MKACNGGRNKQRGLHQPAVSAVLIILSYAYACLIKIKQPRA